jgi:ribonuclease P protein component
VRLTRSDDIRATISQGRRADGGWFRLYFWPKPPGPTRFAVSIRKKVGNACVRNREKRRLKESLRITQTHWPANGWGVVIIDRPMPDSLSGAKRNEIVAGLLAQTQKLTGQAR